MELQPSEPGCSGPGWIHWVSSESSGSVGSSPGLLGMLSRGRLPCPAGRAGRLFGVAPKGSAAAAGLLSIDCGIAAMNAGRGENRGTGVAEGAPADPRRRAVSGLCRSSRKWQPQHVLRLPPATAPATRLPPSPVKRMGRIRKTTRLRRPASRGSIRQSRQVL